MARVAQSRRKPQGPRGDVARMEAARLLAENLTVSEVARQLNVDRKTIQRWRDHPVAAAALPAAREERAAFVGDAIEEARRLLRAAAPTAARTIVERLESAKDADSIRAAATLLDRVGVPRVERVEQVEADIDLSALDPEERAALRRLLTKASGGSGISGSPGNLPRGANE